MSLLQFDAKSTTQVAAPVRARFQKLAQEWKSACRVVSSTTEIAMHPSYQKIIGMGPIVIPLILKELSLEPHQWFWALRAITDANPVDPGNVGMPHAMATDWLHWGAENGYSWNE